MERIDDLGVKNLKLIQDTDLFCFGTDAVLLSTFATVKPNAKVVDLCSGNGIIPVLLSGKTKAEKIIGVEIQKEPFLLAKRSAELNGICGRVDFINCDAKRN
ncbi:MAG: methyltransferase [Clostridiales bacterium]|nr:MAG: methyltransferase [Clostridiales bacterium]